MSAIVNLSHFHVFTHCCTYTTNRSEKVPEVIEEVLLSQQTLIVYSETREREAHLQEPLGSGVTLSPVDIYHPTNSCCMCSIVGEKRAEMVLLQSKEFKKKTM